MGQSLEILILSAADVRATLPMGECIELLARALRAWDNGDATNPLRSKMMLPAGVGLLGMMPAQISPISVAGIKVVAVMPGNHGSGYDSHQGGVLLFETEHGQPLAMADASEITAIRTGAASALATRALARPDAGDLAIIGSGVQARSHLAAILAERKLRRARVWSRNAAHTKRFADREGARHDIRIEAASSAQDAVASADLICTTTSANEPVLYGEWVSPGAHINAAGSSVPHARELDSVLVERARVFVDSRESALNEAGDLLLPMEENCFSASDIQAELGEVLNGKKGGRQSTDEITLFESLGLGIYDLIATHHCYLRAREMGLGTRAPFGEMHDV